MSKLSPKTLKLIAMVVSVVLAGLVYNYLSGLQPESKEASSEAQESVIVAAKDIPKNTLISKDMVRVESISKYAVQKDVCRSVDEIVGTTAKEAIYSGEQVNKRRLFEDQKMAGFIGVIPEDKRAVTVAIDDVTGVAGFAKPGNYVDVMLVSDVNKTITGKLLLQNMLLLAINKVEETEGKDAGKDKMVTATLAATPDEAVRLAVAQKQGTLHFALRPLHPKHMLSLTSEIRIYQGGDTKQAERMPVMPSVPPRQAESAGRYALSEPSKAKQGLSVGHKVNVIRGNKIESVTTR